MTYKVYLYTYPLPWAAAELGAFIILQVVQYNRLFVGTKGNKTENAGIMMIFCLLTVLTTLGAAYFLQFQTYVIILEALLLAFVVLLGLVELLIGFMTIVSFV